MITNYYVGTMHIRINATVPKGQIFMALARLSQDRFRLSLFFADAVLEYVMMYNQKEI